MLQEWFIEIGPSPRAWGEQVLSCTPEAVDRTIPTGVGRTFAWIIVKEPPADHPHGRGENSSVRTGIVLPTGPSPRAWGEPGSCHRVGQLSRTIPTGVGRTGDKMAHGAPVTDHPHGRGENTCRRAARRNGCGPSPRAWGEPPGMPDQRDPDRTIPTGVGRTIPPEVVRRAVTDHPHGCGENRAFGHQRAGGDGPSPRAWGEQNTFTVLESL